MGKKQSYMAVTYGHMGRVITDIIKNTEGIELVAGVDNYTKVPNDYPVFETSMLCDVEAGDH